MSERFRDLFLALRSDPDAAAAAKKASMVIQFRFFEPESSLFLDLTKVPFEVTEGVHSSADVEVGLTPEAAEEVLSGRLHAVEAVRTSRIKVRGGFLKFLALQGFLEAVRTAWRRDR